MDKAYVSIVIDDNNSQLEGIYNIVYGEYGFPLCAAVPINSITPKNITLLHNIENHGGEILSHGLNHTGLGFQNYKSIADKEFGDSYKRLTDEGFNVNGIITVGGNGYDSSEEFCKAVEPYVSKYYKYSNNYGVSSQYSHPRYWLFNGLDQIKEQINSTIKSKSWTVIAGHGLTEDIDGIITPSIWRECMEFLKQKEAEGVLEVVTYRDYFSKQNWQGNVDFGKAKYTVDFYNVDNKTLIESQVVLAGGAAKVPEMLGLNGVKLTGWSADFGKVNDNLRVYANASKPDGTKVGTHELVEKKYHTHTYSKDYTGDASGHYKTCACGAKDTVAAHKPDSENKNCKICGYNIKSGDISQSDINADTENISVENTEATDDALENEPTKDKNKSQVKTNKKSIMPFVLIPSAAVVIGVTIVGFIIFKKKKGKNN